VLYASEEDLPITEVLFHDNEEDGSRLEFRLIHKGSLHSAQSSKRVAEKHRLRKVFHGQLRELWKREPTLNRQLTQKYVPFDSWRHNVFPGTFTIGPEPTHMMVPSDDPGGRYYADIIADNHSQYGFRFIPLVRRKNEFTCALDILFMRRGNPGDIIVSGDIDNRVKTLIDGLRMPRDCSEVDGPPGQDENPFFCLLEDDSLITSLKVTTDRLLTPKDDEEGKSNVEIIVHVTVIDPSALLGRSGLS
jgi:hypothetical protein